MGLMQKLLSGGSNQAATQSGGGIVHDGTHAIDKNKVMAATSADAISPLNPGKFAAGERSVPIIQKPRYFTEEEADAMKELAKQKTEGARQSKRGYEAAGKIEEADAKVHKYHRKYEGVVADNELVKKRADARLGKHLHAQRPAYARLGMSLDQAASNAETRIGEIRAKLQGAKP
ncbi:MULTISPECIES: hypothetical protein [unclassified Microcoleus]|uniref:hypothetical protein n=1 Tax=unclassified Microcoleus TaxID=2642155 RepID=UPI002FD68489